MNARVTVVGGGYAGIAAAKALDEHADVVLVEERDTFVHNVAALRGLVDEEWTERVFLPYDGLLRHGRVVHDRATHVDATGVTLGTGDRLEADYVVIATGSRYPFPAKTSIVDSVDAKAEYDAARDQLELATGILLLGAGPVGLELAGEIRDRHSTTPITIVDPAGDILGGQYPEELRAELRRQLHDLDVRLLLGTRLDEPPHTAPGQHAPFTVTAAGRAISADLWWRCHGIAAASDCLSAELASARTSTGHLRVTEHLHLAGQDTVFAIGDVTAIEEGKKAKAAEEHAEVVAANIITLAGGGTDLATYASKAPSIVLPLGSRGGASYSPEVGVLGAEATVGLKSADLRVEVYRDRLGVTCTASATSAR